MIHYAERQTLVVPSETKCQAFRDMVISRELDLQMIKLVKQNKGSFHVGAAGHEAAQLSAAMSLKKGSDWVFPYYRDLTLCLTLGFTPREVLLDFLGKEASPSSKGRQMYAHWGKRSSKIVSQSACTGTQYLQAVGAAMACKRDASNGMVLVCSGEGATSQGDFHEALNWSARERLPILFLIEDNDYAISVPKYEQIAGLNIANIAKGYEGLSTYIVDGTDFTFLLPFFNEIVEKCRKGEPCLIQANVVRLLPHSSSDDHSKYKLPEQLQEDSRRDCLEILKRELISQGIKSQSECQRVIENAKIEISAAVDWALMQQDPSAKDVLRDVISNTKTRTQELDYEHGAIEGDSVVMIDAINHALDEELLINPKMLIYGEDVGGLKGGVFSATRQLAQKHGSHRVFNSQLAESAIVGTAIGLSLAGYKPIVEIQFSDYIFPAFMQIRNELAMMRYRSGGEWSCPVVIRVPTGGYIAGGHYHSQSIESFFSHMPGLLVAFPSTASDAKGLLKTACRLEDPVLFLEHKFLYRQGFAKSPEPSTNYLLPFGKGRVVKFGTDISIITYGVMVQRSLEAAVTLERTHRVSIEVVDLRTLIPYDKELILTSVTKTGVFENLELRMLDSKFNRRPMDSTLIFRSDVIIIGITDYALDEFSERFPWPRRYYAKIIENLNKAGASVVAFDLLFTDVDSKSEDSTFRKALSNAENIVIAGREPVENLRMDIQWSAKANYQTIFDNVKNINVGNVSLRQDNDGIYRRYHPMSYNTLDKPFLSFGYAILNKYFKHSAQDTLLRLNNRAYSFMNKSIPLWWDGVSTLLNFYGSDRTFPIISADAILDDSSIVTKTEMDLLRDMSRTLGIDSSAMYRPENRAFWEINIFHDSLSNVQNKVKNKICIVGPMFPESKDFFTTPMWYGGEPSQNGIYGVEIHATAVQNFIDALSLSYIITLVYEYFIAAKQKRVIKEFFTAYVPPMLVEQMIDQPSLFKIGGEKRELTMLFSDIREFTHISESYKEHPEHLVALLNEYLGVMTDIIFKNKGTLDKYIGDAIVAFWNAPVPVNNHAEMACLAAVEMQRKLDELRQKWAMEGRPPIYSRIGINTGIVIVGNMGSQSRFSYTAMGDAMNLASRLEAANKYFGTEIIISEYTQKIVKDFFLLRELATITVQGKSEPVKVFDLISVKERGKRYSEIEPAHTAKQGVISIAKD
ncbi:hypothetical protein CHS0354_023863 [Potamilus streckersoni]|uniref:3-methyl-2-oxobutanoate dehydrogenase (2-methylpropanoyl-transferring) n=1 Tax=Potamilus streckersoni TaxID=2493646 RepID=A0AAE0RYZ8_9BIVA|nr:hypothetical protein CHS0354_023863 [Potamilus streckersoni]